MTYSKAIEELTAAIGYVLEAADDNKPRSSRINAANIAERILNNIIDSRPFEPDSIIVSGEDVKAATKPK